MTNDVFRDDSRRYLSAVQVHPKRATTVSALLCGVSKPRAAKPACYVITRWLSQSLVDIKFQSPCDQGIVSCCLLVLNGMQEHGT
jgi:hypothetical protein